MRGTFGVQGRSRRSRSKAKEKTGSIHPGTLSGVLDICFHLATSMCSSMPMQTPDHDMRLPCLFLHSCVLKILLLRMPNTRRSNRADLSPSRVHDKARVLHLLLPLRRRRDLGQIPELEPQAGAVGQRGTLRGAPSSGWGRQPIVELLPAGNLQVCREHFSWGDVKRQYVASVLSSRRGETTVLSSACYF